MAAAVKTKPVASLQLFNQMTEESPFPYTIHTAYSTRCACYNFPSIALTGSQYFLDSLESCLDLEWMSLPKPDLFNQPPSRQLWRNTWFWQWCHLESRVVAASYSLRSPCGVASLCRTSWWFSDDWKWQITFVYANAGFFFIPYP